MRWRASITESVTRTAQNPAASAASGVGPKTATHATMSSGGHRLDERVHGRDRRVAVPAASTEERGTRAPGCCRARGSRCRSSRTTTAGAAATVAQGRARRRRSGSFRARAPERGRRARAPAFIERAPRHAPASRERGRSAVLGCHFRSRLLPPSSRSRARRVRAFSARSSAIRKSCWLVAAFAATSRSTSPSRTRRMSACVNDCIEKNSPSSIACGIESPRRSRMSSAMRAFDDHDLDGRDPPATDAREQPLADDAAKRRRRARKRSAVASRVGRTRSGATTSRRRRSCGASRERGDPTPPPAARRERSRRREARR